MTQEWQYDKGHVTISMPRYIEKALRRFSHPPPSRPQHAPHAWRAPNFGGSVHYAVTTDTSLPLNAEGINLLQQIIGTLLFYARAIDNTMRVAIGTWAAAQIQGRLAHGSSNPTPQLCHHPSRCGCKILQERHQGKLLKWYHFRSKLQK
jgi:hypothetical protein